MDISTYARRAGIAAPEKAAPDVGKPAWQPAPRIQTSAAGRDSQPSDHEDATGAARPLELTAWTDVEIVRFLKRAALFGRRGLPADAAESLADRLVRRDRERDDRRCCVECRELQQTGECFRRLPTSQTQLVRCAGFGWQQP